jgi:peptidoglycan/xylan/chitin deacetylase (PgdA/CDA1 family)
MLVAYLQKKGPAPPPKSVVITTDDGHKSVYTWMLPLVRRYNIPVTLFIYPSAISHASYALTWAQLIELQKTGLFDVQGHTYWHPNFNHEKKKLTPEAYQKFVAIQLDKSKAVLEKKMGTSIDLLAWPFGIYNDELEKAAEQAGYQMAFSIDGRHARLSDHAMSVPRYMIVHQQNKKDFEAIMQGRAEGRVSKAE